MESDVETQWIQNQGVQGGPEPIVIKWSYGTPRNGQKYMGNWCDNTYTWSYATSRGPRCGLGQGITLPTHVSSDQGSRTTISIGIIYII